MRYVLILCVAIFSHVSLGCRYSLVASRPAVRVYLAEGSRIDVDSAIPLEELAFRKVTSEDVVYELMGEGAVGLRVYARGSMVCGNHSPAHIGTSENEMKELSKSPPGCTGWKFAGHIAGSRELWLDSIGKDASLAPVGRVLKANDVPVATLYDRDGRRKTVYGGNWKGVLESIVAEISRAKEEGE